MKLGNRIRLVYAMLHPAAETERGAIPWFRRKLLDVEGLDVSDSTMYRWVEAGRAPEDKSLAVDRLLFKLATEGQETREAEISQLDAVK